MKLNSIEKIIVAVIVIGGLLAAGIFLFIVPAFENIGKSTIKYESLLKEKQDLDAELAREGTIDQEITDAKNEAKKLEGSFYPDLTNYEASEIALAYLADNNLKTDSIQITDITVESLSLEAYSDLPVEYELKTYSQSAKGADENALTEGQFKDGGKVYTVTAGGINDVNITDSEGNVVEKSKYTDTMKKAYWNALCSYAMNAPIYQNVAVVTVRYAVTGTYKDYLGFLDYINDLERATKLENISIPVSGMLAQGGDPSDFFGTVGMSFYGSDKMEEELVIFGDDDMVEENDVTLKLFCVEQMDEIEKLEAGGQSIVVNQ